MLNELAHRRACSPTIQQQPPSATPVLISHLRYETLLSTNVSPNATIPEERDSAVRLFQKTTAARRKTQ